MSNSVRPHRRQPTRLLYPWDFPGKNTGVGCHFLLQCMKVKSESEVAQSCPTLRDLMDCSLPGSSIHGIFQAGVLEWGAIAFSITKFLDFAIFPAVYSSHSQRKEQRKAMPKNAQTTTLLVGYTPEKAMAPHSSTLAWKIPWMEEPGRLQSMRSLRVGHD